MEFKRGVKLEKVMRDLEGFDHEVKMYIYHSLNGRDDEANTYLNAYAIDVNSVLNELQPVDNKAFDSIPEPIINKEVEEVEEVEEDRRQERVVIRPSERIKFNLHNFHE